MAENKGKLFLIPSIISIGTQDKVLSPQVLVVLPSIRYFLVENIRTARRFLSSLKLFPSIEELNFFVLDKDTTSEEIGPLFEPVTKGFHMGVISESGCPGIADPGALAVQYAHRHRIEVIPLVGPSSITLALMASGLNGQRFAFHGYLPVESGELARTIRDLENESRSKHQTQVFIETPYRNNSLLKSLLKHLKPGTRLCIAVDLTGESSSVINRHISEWIKDTPELPKLPAVFLFLA